MESSLQFVLPNFSAAILKPSKFNAIPNLYITHQNPVFYQPASNKTVTILPRNSPVNIANGDKFALLSDKYWFKISIENFIKDNKDLDTTVTDIGVNANDGCLNIDENGNNSMKRSHSDSDESNTVENKKLKLIDSLNNASSDIQDKELMNNEFFDTDNKVDLKNIEDAVSKLDNMNTHKVQQSDGDVSVPDTAMNNASSEIRDKKPIHNKPSDTDLKTIKDTASKPDDTNNHKLQQSDGDIPVPGTSTKTVIKKVMWRDYCIYGLNCYRKNKGHLAEFSHPGDSDYESDPNDNRPECSNQIPCYRLGRQHRRTYKHPRSKNLQRGNTDVNAARKANYESDEGSGNSDLESFWSDCSSDDEFTLGSTISSSSSTSGEEY
ncbi:hypothetical protein FQA39_LY09876 [Lamprigera yunnana]|nr:hypothetical protein FQA39_LY09876 [Lamprigera yunnana]